MTYSKHDKDSTWAYLQCPLGKFSPQTHQPPPSSLPPILVTFPLPSHLKELSLTPSCIEMESLQQYNGLTLFHFHCRVPSVLLLHLSPPTSLASLSGTKHLEPQKMTFRSFPTSALYVTENSTFAIFNSVIFKTSLALPLILFFLCCF